MKLPGRTVVWARRAWEAWAHTHGNKSIARGEHARSRHPDLATLPAKHLVQILESRDASFERRLAAGALLCQLGDPRLNPEDPAMVPLPGGPVTLGLSANAIDVVLAVWDQVGVKREWIEKECPAYTVNLAPFALARFPVTNLEYHAFLSDTGSAWWPTSWPQGAWPESLANHPVWSVPSEAADAYAAWLAERTGRPFRLPTEAEWEYAAAGVERREYPWGDTFIASHTNTAEQALGGTTPVGMLPAGYTPEGLADMGGNIEEYTADRLQPYPGGCNVEDDHRRELGDYRITRGGSFLGYGDLARCRRRHGAAAGAAVGFRLALSMPIEGLTRS